MKTKLYPIDINTSLNLNDFRTSYIPKRNFIFINNITGYKENNKENINSNIKIINTKSYKKLKMTLQKNPIKPKLLNIKNNKIEKKKLDLNLYQSVSTKIFEPDSFNNTTIYYSKHKNKSTFINYYIKDSVNSNPNRAIDIQKYNDNIQKKFDNNYKIIKNSITYSSNKNNNLKKSNNEKNNINLNNKIILNKNKKNNNFSNYNISFSSYNTEVKNEKNNFYLKKPKKHLEKYFSPIKLNISKKENESIDLQKSCRIHPNVQKHQFQFNSINPDDFKIIKQIGFGSFGKIYKTLNIIDDQKYALKIICNNKENIQYMQEKVHLIMDFEKKIKCEGLIKIYGDICLKKGGQYYYYEIMELADKDWEQEIIFRRKLNKYYSEYELLSIMSQLIKTLSLLQKNHITHRDIKIQNILILNNKYKICDFGEARKLNQKGTIVQPARGSELYMSPIQFFGLNKRQEYVQHNTYKSDVFSLGMCVLFAANLGDECLYDIREITDMKIIENILMSYLNRRYSYKFIQLLLTLLEIEEKNRPDFIQLKEIFFKFYFK